MGGAGDDEPVSKRLKASSEQSKGIINCLTALEPASGSSSGLMARQIQSDGDKDVVGSKGLTQKVEFVQIIGNALHTLGYEKSGFCLEEESGIPFHSSVVNMFTQQILNGEWDRSIETLRKISQLDETVVKSASSLILEQKLFEFLNGDKVMDALNTLRTEIVPLGINYSKVRELSSCIVAPSFTAVVRSSSQNTAKENSRSKLLEELRELLPPTVMVTGKWLEYLVEHALYLQQDACRFHNSLDRGVLYTDHHCGEEQLPSQTLQLTYASGSSSKSSVTELCSGAVLPADDVLPTPQLPSSQNSSTTLRSASLDARVSILETAIVELHQEQAGIRQEQVALRQRLDSLFALLPRASSPPSSER